MSDWHRRRVEAAARALASVEPGVEDLLRAEAAVHAADGAGHGVVPREEFERLALDFSEWRVRALQDEDLLGRALETLDRIAGSGPEVAAELRDLAFTTAVEIRALLDARSDVEEDEPS